MKAAKEHSRIFTRQNIRGVVYSLAAFYIALLILSIIIAHVVTVLFPYSELPSHFIAPIASGLAFIDEHWKATLLVIAPFLIPKAEELLDRMTKFTVGATSVELHRGGVHPKPRPDDEDAL